MSKIDFKNIKPGDEVRIANGDWFTATSGLCAGDSYNYIYVTSGDCGVTEISAKLITDHHPVFDWDTAKAGMCFLLNNSARYFYVGPTLEHEGISVFRAENRILGQNVFVPIQHHLLTRHPEGDYESVKKD